MPRFSLRDLFWLTLVVALACAIWLGYRRISTLEAEVAYFRAKGRPMEYVETPIEQVLAELSLDYGIWIDVDWSSFEEAGLFHRQSKISKTITAGSLHNAIYHIFERTAEMTPGPGRKVTLSARPKGAKLDVAR